MRGLRVWLWLALGSFVLTVAQPNPVNAGLGDIPIKGTVIDSVGRPLADVRVDDSSKFVFTDANGNFSIDQPAGQGFTLTASRLGLVPDNRSGTAVPLTRVDFTLLYVISSAVSPTAFNSVPQPLDITVKTYAPLEDVCVKWTDQTSGAMLGLTHQSTNGSGESTWTGQYEVPAERVDGPYSFMSVSQSCTVGTDLTKRVSGSYILDSVAPLFDVTERFPNDGDATRYATQPIRALVSESGSGIDVNSSSLTLLDETVETASTKEVSQQGNWLVTAPFTLVPGNRYRASLTAVDRAGNSSTTSWRFTSVSLEVDGQGTTAVVEETPAARHETYDLVNDIYYFEDIPLSVESLTVTASPAVTHGGRARALLQFPYAELQVEYSLGPLAQRTAVLESSGPLLTLRYAIDPVSVGTTALALAPAPTQIANVSAVVPRNATDVRIAFGEVNVFPSLLTCMDPLEVASNEFLVGCGPDWILRESQVISPSPGVSVSSFGHGCWDRITVASAQFGQNVDYAYSDTCEPINAVASQSASTTSSAGSSVSLCPGVPIGEQYRETCWWRERQGNTVPWVRQLYYVQTELRDPINQSLAGMETDAWVYKDVATANPWVWWYDADCCHGWGLSSQWREISTWSTQATSLSMGGKRDHETGYHNRNYCHHATECKELRLIGTAAYRFSPVAGFGGAQCQWGQDWGLNWLNPIVYHTWIVRHQSGAYSVEIQNHCPGLVTRNRSNFVPVDGVEEQ